MILKLAALLKKGVNFSVFQVSVTIAKKSGYSTGIVGFTFRTKAYLSCHVFQFHWGMGL